LDLGLDLGADIEIRGRKEASTIPVYHRDSSIDHIPPHEATAITIR
jgi:hypothetical protein